MQQWWIPFRAIFQSISQWLYIHLKDKVDNLLICNPTYVAKKQGAKTDFRDALHLANELRTNHIQPVFHDTSHWMALRTTASGYLDIVEEIVRFKNRLKAVSELKRFKRMKIVFTKILHG